MKLKNVHYVLLASLFIMAGCGGSSSSDDNSNERVAEEILVPLSLNTAIETWAEDNSKKLKNASYLIGTTYMVNSNKTRAIIQTYDFLNDIEEPNSDKSVILNISDLNSITSLAENQFYREDQPLAYKIIDDDYIMIAETGTLSLYDYTTGELLSQTHYEDINMNGVTYTSIENDYLIYAKIDSPTLTKVDFTNRRVPLITELPTESSSNDINESDYNLTINDITRLKTTEKGFELYNVSNPQNPTLLSSYDISDRRACSVYLLSDDKQHLFIHAWQKEDGCDTHFSIDLPFQVVNISNLSNPTLKASTTLTRDYYGRVDATWEHLANNIYLISAEEELAVYNLNDYTKTASFTGKRIVTITISRDRTKLYVLSAPTYRFWLSANTLSVLSLTDLSIINEYPYAETQGLFVSGPNFTDLELLENETKVKLTNAEGESKIIDLQ